MAPIKLPSFASVADLSDWIGEPIEDGSADYKRAEAMLHTASVLVRTETGRTWVNSDDSIPTIVESPPEALATVTLLCASRGYISPESMVWNRWADRVDDGGIDRSTKEVGLSLTAAERQMLSDLKGRRTGGIGTLSTKRGDMHSHDDCKWWVNGPDIPPDQELL